MSRSSLFRPPFSYSAFRCVKSLSLVSFQQFWQKYHHRSCSQRCAVICGWLRRYCESRHAGLAFEWLCFRRRLCKAQSASTFCWLAVRQLYWNNRQERDSLVHRFRRLCQGIWTGGRGAYTCSFIHHPSYQLYSQGLFSSSPWNSQPLSQAHSKR